MIMRHVGITEIRTLLVKTFVDSDNTDVSEGPAILEIESFRF